MFALQLFDDRLIAALTRQLTEARKGEWTNGSVGTILPTAVGRKTDSAKPTSRPRLLVSMLFKLGRAEACVGGLGAFGRSALLLRFLRRRV
jgi:hypothetical protein